MKNRMRVRSVGAEDPAPGGGVEGGTLDGVPAHRRRWPVRVSLSAARMGKAQRFVALRYQKKAKPKEWSEPEQYQLFDTPEYSYRAFTTNLDAPIDVVVGFYRQRAGAENLIKEANNDAGLAAHPSGRWAMNCVHFQLAMLAYNLNCWLMLFNRDEQPRPRICVTSRWPPRACASCFWRPKSCATPGLSGALQRSLRRPRALPALDGPGAGDCAGWRRFPAGTENCIDLKKQSTL